MPNRMKLLSLALCLGGILALTGCFAPPLQTYTFDMPPPSVSQSFSDQSMPYILIDRVDLPDYLDGRDILVREGNLLKRSDHGRMASRLSAAITDNMTAWLNRMHPELLIVTEQLPARQPDYRLSVTITRFDITSDGQGALAANWSLIPSNDRQRMRDYHFRTIKHGDVSNDKNVIVLEQTLISALTTAINKQLASSPLLTGRKRGFTLSRGGSASAP